MVSLTNLSKLNSSCFTVQLQHQVVNIQIIWSFKFTNIPAKGFSRYLEPIIYKSKFHRPPQHRFCSWKIQILDSKYIFQYTNHIMAIYWRFFIHELFIKRTYVIKILKTLDSWVDIIYRAAFLQWGLYTAACTLSDGDVIRIWRILWY